MCIKHKDKDGAGKHSQAWVVGLWLSTSLWDCSLLFWFLIWSINHTRGTERAKQNSLSNVLSSDLLLVLSPTRMKLLEGDFVSYSIFVQCLVPSADFLPAKRTILNIYSARFLKLMLPGSYCFLFVWLSSFFHLCFFVYFSSSIQLINSFYHLSLALMYVLSTIVISSVV